MIFLVQYTRTGCHPLHIAAAYNTAVTGTVVVRHLALKGNGNGFEAPVGMHTHTAGFFSWAKIDFRIIVHHKKRTHTVMSESVSARKKIMYPETISHHMRCRWCQYDLDLLCFVVHDFELNDTKIQ